MDVKEYIESGILERYIFQDVSPQEMQEVQCLSKIYPEIAEVLEGYNSGIENFATKTAVTPPQEIKAQILSQIKNTKQESILEEDAKPKRDNVVKMKAPNYKLYMAACVVGLLCLFGYSIYQNNNLKDANNNIAQIEKKYMGMKDENGIIMEESILLSQNLEFITNENTSKILLNGTDNYKNHKVTVYWNKENNKVLMEQNALAQLEKEQQYQLWAIVDGKPVDLGVFDTNKDALNYYKDVNEPQAFAITIEPRGGSASPTMENMVVVGNVAS